MGFLKKLGSAIVNNIKTGVTYGLAKGIEASIDSYDDVYGYYSRDNKWRAIDMSNSVYVKSNSIPSKSVDENSYLYNMAKNKTEVIDTELNTMNIPDTSGYSLKNTLRLPDWGYDIFINERSSFQKGLSGPTNDPGYFYFKIFFDFNTNYGLFGGILNAEDPYSGSVNTALKYLYSCRNNYRQERLLDRANALVKFTKILSFINSQAPWFFKSVDGLSDAGIPTIEEIGKERFISINCSEDAVDMRLSTMMELYKYAAYDEYSHKEIIPENLRKFDMSIMLFAAPIKRFHNALFDSTNNKVPFKRFRSQEYDNMPSFKLFTFLNCELSLDTLSAMIPNSISNEVPFQLGKNTIKIKYDNVYVHTMNEFNRILFGTTGIYYNKYELFSENAYPNQYMNDDNLQEKRYDMLYNALERTQDLNFFNPKNYKELIDASEAVAHTNLMKITGQQLGNISDSILGNIYNNQYTGDTRIGSTYYKTKLNWQFNKNFPVGDDRSKSVLVKLLDSLYGSIYKMNDYQNMPMDNGWLMGYREVAIGSPYWKQKLEKLKGKSSFGNQRQ